MDTIYGNGTVITMEQEKIAEAVLVREGMICGVGSKEEMEGKANGSYHFVDLKGAALLPAFIDSHSHFMGYATSFLQVSLNEISSLEDVEGKIKEFIRAKRIKPGDWVQAGGFDNNTLPNKHWPSLELLDRAAPQNPVVIVHQSGHTGMFNTMALEKLHVTEKTKAVKGGRIELKEGKLTGYMEENAFLEFQKQLPMPSREALYAALLEAQRRYASYGITTIQEGMMMDDMLPLYQHLIKNHMLKLDVVGYLDINHCSRLLSVLKEHKEVYREHFKIGGYKIFLDGSPQNKTAWMLTPYASSQEPKYGYPILEDEEVESRIQKAITEDMQLLAHCNGDAACGQYVNCYKKVIDSSSQTSDIRPVMIHAQLVQREQLKVMKEYGMIPSFFIGHIWYWGDVHIKNFGWERAKFISPAKTAEKLGIPFTLHQDTPVTEPNMLESIACAVNRKTKEGAVLGEEERISVYEAVKAVTQYPAYQYGEEDTKGSIREGKHADFVVLSENPLLCNPEDLARIEVLGTIKDGQWIYQKEN